MDTSDWLSALALVVSGGAFGLEMRRWFESGPRLRLSLMADAETYPQDDGKSKLILHVINRGDVPTTLTHMVVNQYRSVVHRRLNKRLSAGFVPSPAIIPGMDNLPFELGVNKIWHGALNYDSELSKAREKGHLYVGVVASHSSKDFIVHVPPMSDALKEKVGENKRALPNASAAN